jgi:hypothetical protein
MSKQEWYLSGRDRFLKVGQIGCLFIEATFETERNERGGLQHNYNAPLGYKVVWYESESPISGEGIAVSLNELFPMTEDGLEAAQKRAIEWGMELLQEAMDSLKGEETKS